MKLKIFGADWCTACIKAKKLAEEKEVEVPEYGGIEVTKAMAEGTTKHHMQLIDPVG